MTTIWGLFASPQVAERVLADLARRGLGADSTGAVLQEAVLRQSVPDEVPSAEAEAPHPARAPGFSAWGAASRLLHIADTAPVVATGILATILGQAVSRLGSPAGRLKRSMLALGIAPGHAAAYAEGVLSGGVLLAVRVDAAQEREAVMILRRHQVGYLAGLPD